MSNPGLAPPNVAVNALNYGAKGDGVTDDSNGVQAAIAAAAAKSLNLSNIPVDVWLPSGYGFKLSKVTMATGVRLWAYGTLLLPSASLDTNGMIQFPGSAIANSGVLGGTYNGTGAETVNQCAIMTISGGTLTDCDFAGTRVTNWGTGPFYLRNPTRVRAVHNTFLNVGANSALNAINFVGNTVANAMLAAHNFIEGPCGYSIAFVMTGPVSGIIRAAAISNIVNGLGGGSASNSGCIAAELDNAVTISRVLIADNDIAAVASGAGAVILGSGAGGNTLQRAKVSNNNITNNGTGQGISVFGTNPDISAVDNNIRAVTPMSGTYTYRSGNRFTSGANQGRAVLVAGTVTVNTTEILAGDNIILTVVAPGGTRGEIQLGTIVAGTSFVINSIQPGTASTLQTLDTSTVFWKIEH